MTNKKPTRASQSQSDSTKVKSQAATVKPKTVNKPWTPPSYLDTPNAPNGYRHRWVRIETLGVADTKNIQGRLRSGYELVRSDEYYEEVDKRIRLEFPHKFGNSKPEQTSKPTQNVASATRSTKAGRKQVRLTSSQVAIARKLGVPLEEYAKQLINTKEV